MKQVFIALALGLLLSGQARAQCENYNEIDRLNFIVVREVAGAYNQDLSSIERADHANSAAYFLYRVYQEARQAGLGDFQNCIHWAYGSFFDQLPPFLRVHASMGWSGAYNGSDMDESLRAALNQAVAEIIAEARRAQGRQCDASTYNPFGCN